jgi:hypothetical protein
MRMVIRRGYAYAVEFLDPDPNLRGGKVVAKFWEMSCFENRHFQGHVTSSLLIPGGSALCSQSPMPDAGWSSDALDMGTGRASCEGYSLKTLLGDLDAR